MPSVSLWAFSAEILFLYSRLSRPAGCSKRLFTSGVAAKSSSFSSRTTGSFSEDRPLGWDPVARRAIGRAMEWPATTVTAAIGGSRELLLGPWPARRKHKRSGCWVPQPELVSEEKAPGTSPTIYPYCQTIRQGKFFQRFNSPPEVCPPAGNCAIQNNPVKGYVV